jgi:hypothetical protein
MNWEDDPRSDQLMNKYWNYNVNNIVQYIEVQKQCGVQKKMYFVDSPYKYKHTNTYKTNTHKQI